MFNNSSRDSAALDRYIVGTETDTRVILKCENGHTWPATMTSGLGTSSYDIPDCPECGEPATDDPTIDTEDESD